MDNTLAKEIITEYAFGDYKLESLYKFLSPNITGEREKKMFADTLLAKALQKGVIALSNNTEEKEQASDKVERKEYSAKYDGYCGFEGWTCPQCGKDVTSKPKFCPGCGAELVYEHNNSW